MLKKILFSLLGFVVCLAVVIAGIRVYYSLAYPVKFQSEVDIFSKKYNVDKCLIMSVIKVESSFKQDAVSDAGAIGLMQIMPKTAVYVSELSNISDFSLDKLTEPETNIEIGSYYIKYLIDKFKDERLALAAYNAGEGTVKYWLENKEYCLDGKTLTVIPYRETEVYLKRIERAKNVYSQTYKD